jgi:hypothetical protein
MHPRTRELMDHLDSHRATLRAAFDAVPEAVREREPAPGRWSAAGIIEHLAIVEQRVAATLSEKIAAARNEGLAALTSSEPVLPTIELTERVKSRTTRFNAPEVLHPTGLDANAAWAALERATGILRDTLQATDGLAVSEILVPHPRFGQLSVYEWFALIGAHEARHAEQIREIIAAV